MDMSFLKPNNVNMVGTVLILLANLISGMISQPVSHAIGLSNVGFVAAGGQQFNGPARNGSFNGGFQFNSSMAQLDTDGSRFNPDNMEISGFDMLVGRALVSVIDLAVFGLLSYAAISFVTRPSVASAKTSGSKR